MTPARLLALLLTFAIAAPAAAEPAWIAMPTWLRVAPDASARVIDELQDGAQVERLACEGAWCHVRSGRAGGYVAAALLEAAPRALLTPAPGGGCFPAQHFTPEGPIALRLCPAVPAASLPH